MILSLRAHPFPYVSMLAICSDLDETPDSETYFEICRFLNTHENTQMGEGVGLEVGNTIYFSMPPGQFSYYNASDIDRERIHNLIKTGHIDCLHSFGDLVTTREEILTAWDTLVTHDCLVEIWIDHGKARSNFDSDIMCGQGAKWGAPCYHADLSLSKGIKYVWNGRVTSVVAKDAPLSLGAVYSSKHPVLSIVTIAKEVVKIALGWLGSTKYYMHAQRDIMRDTRLESGQTVIEFIRSNPSWGGVSHNETADGIGEVLTEKVLNQLVQQGGTTILYTHLGKATAGKPICDTSIEGFRRLARYVQQRKILVTTTRRLLGFRNTMRDIRWKSTLSESVLTITAHGNFPEIHDLEGLTWYIPEGIDSAVLMLGDIAYPLQVNEHDNTGRQSVSVPWHPLVFPE